MITLLTIVSTLASYGQAYESWKSLAKQADERQAADDLAGAEALRWAALKGAQTRFGVDSPFTVPVANQLCGTLHLERRDAEAEPILRHSVEVANQSGDRKLLGIALSGLATAIAGEGDRARAEPILRRSVTLLEEAEGLDALDTANAANNLAALYSDTGQYSEAEKEMTLALSCYEKHFNSVQPILAMGLRNMFVILFKERRIEEAEPYLMRALAIGERSFPESSRMAQLRFAQGLLQESRGKFKDAAETLQQVIGAQEKIFGPRHPELAHSLLVYSDVLRHLHRRSEAQEALKRGNSMLKSLQ